MPIHEMTTSERIAAAFHAAYEALAPANGYETRKASAKPWAEVPENNRALMIATVEALIANHMIKPGPASGDQANTGHGHVRPRPDGVKMRCGGPGVCSECSREAARTTRPVQVQFVGTTTVDARPCSACDGRGLVPVGDDGELYECRSCDGTGGA